MNARFPRSLRLAHDRQYQRVYAARRSRARGSIVVHAAANGLAFSRVGLSVGRRAAPRATDRNRIKRMLREAFRLSAGELPGGFDFVISARSRSVPELPVLRTVLMELARAATADAGRGHDNARSNAP
ncbi:MAG: ribonuclease P protein component [Phycisphaerae bacterium]|nr:ribonuclease P protein component [Phycisphaerae bacterium]